MMSKFVAADNSCIVQIFNSDKEIKNTSETGIVTTNWHKPMMNSCQIGVAQSVGKNIDWVNEGDMVLFSHVVEDIPERELYRDNDSEYRVVLEKGDGITGELYGKVITYKSGKSQIIPKKNYVVAEPRNKDLALQNAIFQIPISSINPHDEVAKKLGVKVGDLVVCLPYAGYEIWIQRVPFWFIYLEDIMAVNVGYHKLAISRQHVSQIIRQGSTHKIETLDQYKNGHLLN